MPAGRPTKFSPDTIRQIEICAKKGWTNAEIAELIGVTERTIYNWLKNNPDFFHALNEWKEAADAKVERSLYERAMGYSHPEDKIFNNGGEEMVIQTMKHYPPDTTAAIFWLKNRKREQWRDQQHVRHSGTVNDLSDLTDEELAERRAALRSALKDTDE
jgi:transcriptional regulator with XRE-family HTH domain